MYFLDSWVLGMWSSLQLGTYLYIVVSERVILCVFDVCLPACTIIVFTISVSRGICIGAMWMGGAGWV